MSNHFKMQSAIWILERDKEILSALRKEYKDPLLLNAAISILVNLLKEIMGLEDGEIDIQRLKDSNILTKDNVLSGQLYNVLKDAYLKDGASNPTNIPKTPFKTLQSEIQGDSGVTKKDKSNDITPEDSYYSQIATINKIQSLDTPKNNKDFIDTEDEKYNSKKSLSEKELAQSFNDSYRITRNK